MANCQRRRFLLKCCLLPSTSATRAARPAPSIKRPCMQEPERNIVVVDDDAGMNQAIERLLCAAGLRVLTFPSGEALLEGGAAGTAACLVFDIHLPGLSGFELHERLRRGGTNAPVIFITAYGDPASLAQARVAGAAGYFTKPFSGPAFLEAIANAVRPRAKIGHLTSDHSGQ